MMFTDTLRFIPMHFKSSKVYYFSNRKRKRNDKIQKIINKI